MKGSPTHYWCLYLHIFADDIVLLSTTQAQEVDTYTYLGSIVGRDGGSDKDIQARIGKARTAFLILRQVWNSKHISTQIKLRIFNSNVKSVLLYGAETWRTTKATSSKLQTFINRCLRHILGIYWPNTITNEELWQTTQQEQIETQIRRRKWGWIGHTLRKPFSNTTRQALTWNPQGKRKPGRPKNSWKRSVEAELKEKGTSWKEAEKIAQRRTSWKKFINDLCSPKSQRV